MPSNRGAVYPSAYDDDGYGSPNSYGSRPPPQQRQSQQYHPPQPQQPQYAPPRHHPPPQQYSQYAPPPQQQPYYQDDGYRRSQQPPHRPPPAPRSYDDDDDEIDRQSSRDIGHHSNNRGAQQKDQHGGGGGKKQYDTEPAPSAENTKNRKCHDVFFLILFIIMFAAMCAVGYYSVRYGNVDRLIYGRDSEGNLCGSVIGPDSARDLQNQTNLLYFIGDSNNYRRCVDSCPDTTATDSGIVCKYDIPLAAARLDRIAQVEANDCTYTIKSKPVLNRCVPIQLLTDIKAAANASFYNETYTLAGGSYKWGQTLSIELNARDAASIIYQDLATNWWVILVCVGAAFVLAYGYLLLLQFFAGAIVWFTIFIVLIVAWVLAAYFIYNYVRIKVLHQGLLSVGFDQVDAVLYNEKLLLVLGCIIGGIALILSILVLCLIRRIRLATRIIKEASMALRAMPWIALFPFFKYTVVLIWMAIFVAVMALLATSGTTIAAQVEDDINDGLERTGRSYSSTYTLQYLQIYFTFGFLWVYNWLVAIGQTTVAGAIATWYWARDKKRLPSVPVLRSLGRTCRYHLGSLALGSLLIAIVQLIRLIIVELQRRVKGTGNKAAAYILCCLQCCFKCVEALLKMLTKNAYVEIAVYGYSFCTAARMAMQLIAANVVRLVVVHKVSNFLIFVGKLAVVFITTLGGLGLLVYLEGDDEVFANYAVPLIFIIIFSYITASAFLSTFGMAITTIFLSFCEDSQRNDGSRERPYYMSKNLQGFVDAHAHAKPAV
ncbi:plasma-membrane choline transporter-domain-containing protein [Powellomyces hirtus]|nr:plasma-membrane choline transporter-domain-containing protein [Powellomyces hirtus]